MQSSSSLRERWSGLSKRDKDLLATAGLLSFAGAAGASALYFAKKNNSLTEPQKDIIEKFKALDEENYKTNIDVFFALSMYQFNLIEAHKGLPLPPPLNEAELEELEELSPMDDKKLKTKQLKRFFALFDRDTLNTDFDLYKEIYLKKPNNGGEEEKYFEQKKNALPEDFKKAVFESEYGYEYSPSSR